MMDHEYNKTTSDHCTFIKKLSNEDFIIFLLYMDDILIIGHDTKKNESLKRELSKSFTVKDLGPARQIFGNENYS